LTPKDPSGGKGQRCTACSGKGGRRWSGLTPKKTRIGANLKKEGVKNQAGETTRKKPKKSTCGKNL